MSASYNVRQLYHIKNRQFYADSAQGFISCSEMCAKHKYKNERRMILNENKTHKKAGRYAMDT